MNHELTILMPTVGELITFESLDRIVKYTPSPYKLILWYDACGRGINASFVNSLGKYTEDIIIVHQNKGLAAAVGFGLLYLNYGYLILALPDSPVFPDYFNKITEPFDTLPSIGAAGECWPHPARPMKSKWELNDPDRCIDGVMMINRKAIDSIGGISPAYWGTGPFHHEIQRRMAVRGWNYAAISGLCAHGGLQHEGRNLDPEWQRRLETDNRVWLKMENDDFKGYNWWAK